MPNDNVPTATALVPYLNVKNAAEAIAFYNQAFGAKERFRLIDPGDGRIGHAELDIGGARLMISDEYPDYGALGPVSIGGTPVKMHLTVADVDTVFKHVVSLGAVALRPVKNQFHGNRSGTLADPFGHIWHIETIREVVSPQDMQSRWNALAHD